MVYRLTHSHKIFLNRIDSPAWNLCSYCLFHKRIPADTLARAMNEVVQKNDALRMVLSDDTVSFADDTPRTYESVSFANEEAFLIWAREKANVSVAGLPGMWTAYLIDINGQTGIFNIGHHIMCDALNVAVLYRKITDALNGRGEEISYSEHLVSAENYRKSPAYKKDEAYWDRVLSGELPLAFSGRSIGECDNIEVVLPPVHEFCASHHISEAAFLYSAAGLLLLRLRETDGISVGIPVLGRTTQREMDSLGLFMHDLPMLIQGGEKRFPDLAGEVESNLIDLFRHQRYDLPNRTLFDVSIDYSVYPATKDYTARVVYNDYVSTAMEFHFLQKDRLELTVRAQKGLFRDLSVVTDALERLIRHVLISPQTPVSDIPIAEMPPMGEITTIPERGLYSLIESRSSGRITDGVREYTLADLKRDAERIDAAVRGKKRIIGILCERGYLQLAAIYGVIRGGNAYLPISSEFPEERIRLLLRQSKCDTVLTQRKYADLVPDAQIIEDVLAKELSSPAPPAAALPDDPRYVIFTSGSTGTPKGAVVSNRSAVNRVQWMCRRYFSSDTVVMLKTPYTFDVSVWEIFGFALGGFSLYILPPEDHYRQDRVLAHIRKGGVTDLHFVPTVFGFFLDALEKDGGALPSLKNIYLSGEALSASLVRRAPAPVHNLYGPTECAVDVTSYDCAETETDPVPIGKPIDNCRIYVLDQRLRLLPVGVPGQIGIAGTPVGIGYVNDPKKTEEVFVPDPFGDGRLYLTGDVGYRREDGQLVYVGRKDQQIKINGQRIELGEIETVMSAFVPAAAVIVREQRLIAFYTGSEQNDLREKLSRFLPRYMVPHRFIHLEKMPVTASGKADHKALAAFSPAEKADILPPASREERLLAEVVKEVLCAPVISIADNFYELGGDSLSALTVVTTLRERGCDLSIVDFLKSDSLADAAGKMVPTVTAPPRAAADRFPVPPIVSAYLHEAPSDPATFAQTCVIKTESAASEVRGALDAVVSRHEMLRATLTEDGLFCIGDAKYRFTEKRGPVTWEPVSFDLRHGPLVDAVLYPGSLKLTIHHFAADAVSWTIIMNDLTAALKGEPLPEKTELYSEWAASADPGGAFLWPEDMLPVIHPNDPLCPEERYCFSVRAAAEDTVLTALALAANALAGGEAGICVETHGRTDARYHRTVGWFTAIFPFRTGSLQETKAYLSAVPDIGAGYLPAFGRLPDNASILFNYTAVPEGTTLGPLPLFPGKINVNCLRRENRLFIEIGAPEGRHRKGIAGQLGRMMQNDLETRSAQEGPPSPPDAFEEAFSLTPTQLGIYRHWDSYHLKYTFTIGEEIDDGRLEQAVSLLIKRHPILKSSFVEQSDGTVTQRITKEPRQGAERASLFHVTRNGDRLTVSTHHVILDGWSLSILAGDLLRFYRHPTADAAPAGSFGLYAEWRNRQPDGIEYWQKLLAGCSVSSDLPHRANAKGKRSAAMDITISSAGIAAYARAHRVSVNTVLETAFSYLLLKYNRTAVFGKMLSGRNAPIKGIDEIVGPFAHMIPVYVKNGDDVLARIHEQSVMANEFGLTPLAELYAHTDLHRINILFVFENYPSVTGLNLIDFEEENEFDLTVTVKEVQNALFVRFSYAPDKYERSVIEDAATEYETVLRRLVSGSRAELPPRISAPRHYEAAADETERMICGLFEKVLRARVGRNDNFYDLGGTSLHIMELLSQPLLREISPSEFMQAPTPAGLAALLRRRSGVSPVVGLYVPEDTVSAYVLFPYGGGDAAAYTALVAEFRKRRSRVALYFVPWECDYDAVAERLSSFTVPLRFYSHCAGAVIAMKLLDRVSNAEQYIAGANIPPQEIRNVWPSVSDGDILAVLRKAGMPELPEDQGAAMISRFRKNTEEYFDYFQNKTEKTPVSVSLVLCKDDIFTESHPFAAELWEQYVERVDGIRFIAGRTHYFQSENAAALADILLTEA